MSYSYKITLRYAILDASVNPPALVKDLFPSTWQDALETTLNQAECVITFADPQTPVDLGQYVKVETI
jgi:hypothetical protein